jgi:3,4-dihydroxy 2-butanone 4-phosphate synthase/GTP cyclohydrolase II
MKNKSVQKITKRASAYLPIKYGNFQISIYNSKPGNLEQVVLTTGNISKQPVLVRLHSQCFTGDTLLSLRCDCRDQLVKSMKMITKNGSGILIYLNQEGRGIGLLNKIKTYALQEKNIDTVEANRRLRLAVDAREYQTAAGILKTLGITKINLLTNNPDKIEQLEKNGITIVKRIPLEITPNKFNKFYLSTKKNKLGHKLTKV